MTFRVLFPFWFRRSDCQAVYANGRLSFQLHAGVQRTPTNFPVHYLGTNVPQAWTAGTIFMVLRIILGFQPDAPRDKLYLDPCLPDWLRDLTVRDLCVGKRNYDIRFWRDGDTSSWEVLRGDPARISRRTFAVGPIIWGGQERARRDKPLSVSLGALSVEGSGFEATNAWVDGGHGHLRPGRVAPVGELLVNELVGVLAQ